MTVSPIPSLGATRADVERIVGDGLAEFASRARPSFTNTAIQSDAYAQAITDRVMALFPVEAGDVGWRMVPVEPTPEMWRAGERAFDPDPDKHHDTIIGGVWSAMLAASPPLAEGEGHE